MSDSSVRLGLPYLQPSQAQKHVTHNEALQRLDMLTQLVVETRGAETPPVVPADGEIHALGPAPQGVWAGRPGMLAQWVDPAWVFLAPQEGWRAWDRATGTICSYHGGAWQDVVPVLQNLDGVGIGTGSDATNRFALAGDAALFSHAGADHRIKINKAAVGDTASLLYQSGFTGHAEIGLTGSNDFQLKVSADGAVWTAALTIAATTGLVGGAAVQAAPTDVTPGRLMRSDYGYGPGNLLGPVSQSGGTPTGAVIERGTTATGDYVRLADGTQICTFSGGLTADASLADGSIFRSSDDAVWTFPAAFADPDITLSAHADTDGRWVNARCISSTAAVIRHFSAGSSPDAIPTCACAIGKWF